MATCSFCSARFTSQQAVRAHLKACPAYKAGVPKASLPKATLPKAPVPQPPSLEADRAQAIEAEVAAEQARLRLRQAQAAHRELDAKDAERERKVREAHEAERARQKDLEEARLRAEREERARVRRQWAEEGRQRERRRIIQNVKDEVLGGWGGLGDRLEGIPSDLHAQAIKEIERELSESPVDELPRSEVVKIAEGVRERVYRPWREQQEARRQRQAARQERIRHGIEYADGELRKEDDLDFSERWRIRTDVQQLLEGKLTGEETQAEVRMMAGEFIRKELAKRGERIMAKTERKVSGFFVCQSCGRAWDLEDESSLKCTCGGLLQAAEDPDLEEDEKD